MFQEAHRKPAEGLRKAVKVHRSFNAVYSQGALGGIRCHTDILWLGQTRC